MQKNKSLHGRKALITGAARRVGRAVALHLAELGADIVIHYRSSQAEARQLQQQIEGLGQGAKLWCFDLREAQQLEQLVDQSFAQFGGCDILINNASPFNAVAFDDISLKDWNDYLGVHLLSPFLLSRAFAKALQAPRGDIINIVDAHLAKPRSGYLPYGVSKVALEHLTKCLAYELAPNIRVNAIAPGYVLRPETIEINSEQVPEQVLLQQRGCATDVAEAAAYLLNAKYVNAETLYIDGGSLAR